MEVKVVTQRTPNPNALKFVSNLDLRRGGKVSFSTLGECSHVPLIWEVLSLPNVTQVHLFENTMTVTQNGLSDWQALSAVIEDALKKNLGEHNPDFKTFDEVKKEKLSPEMKQIDEILDEAIRPALQADGGDLEIMEYSNNILSIRYEGACGTCPSAASGTLDAIQAELAARFDPNIQVCIV
jgi:NFU1 iron-sulfur cluster scaffold homolog, mitochondrial